MRKLISITVLGLGAAAMLLAAGADACAQDEGGQGGRRGRRGRMGRGGKRGGRMGQDKAPKVGAKAPTFELVELDAKTGKAKLDPADPEKKKKLKIKLADFAKATKPVALVFGSYTWPPFRSEAPTINKLYKKYKDQVQFYIVYIKEAHPSDGRQVGKNTQEGIEFKQPTTEAERLGIAKKACAALKLDLPCLLDGMDNKVGEAYSGWPDRLFVVGHDGKIAYSGARGPRGFDPEGWEVGIKKAIKATPKPIEVKEKPVEVVKEDPDKDKNESEGDTKKK